MLSKSQISFLTSLQLKKQRKEHGLFLVEGLKSVAEFIKSDYQIETIYYTPAILSKLDKISGKIKLEEVKPEELLKISALNTPQDVLAIVRIPEEQKISTKCLKGNYSLLLDGIQDPGNLGTIIRTADWFGFTQIICSNDTVEAYNPKVVQASMGSLARIKLHYTDLVSFLDEHKLSTYVTALDGSSIYEVDFKKEGLLILGNEGNGIRPEILKKGTHQISIPRVGKAESLNVAVCAGICCAEIRRKRS